MTDKKKEKEVNRKIKDILQSVKDQKQHIENQLATNEKRIQEYRQEFEKMKQNDYSELTHQQKLILNSISDGLESQGIPVQKIIGFSKHTYTTNPQNNLTETQIIQVQEMLIKKLLGAIEDNHNHHF